MKIALVTPGALLLAIVAYIAYAALVANPRVMQELANNPEGERAARAMVLYFPDGKVIPVNYLMEGDQVFAGSDFGWWRAFEQGDVPVRMLIRGRYYKGLARVELEDLAYVEDVFSRLRPTVPGWLTHWGKLVIISEVTPDAEGSE